MFIDTAEIEIQAGDGGSGLLSFHRARFIPKGGPDGGDGGNGGHVIFKADVQLHTLMDFRYRRKYKAGRGQSGGPNNRHGKNGRNIIIRLPAGTIVYNAETDEMLADLVEENMQVVIAVGGKGGKGNARFKSSTNRAPRKFTVGYPGVKLKLRLELKLLADVGLVGLPNAGKSTLLSRISDARPKIADYPFTTLIPNLGIVRVGDMSSFVVADIPGLIKGAHLGKGLGDEFLRHIERTKILLFLIDCTSSDIRKDYETLMEELRSFDPSILEKTQMVAITKSDLLSEAQSTFNIPVDITISSVTGDNLDKLKNMLWDKIKTDESKTELAEMSGE